jgi:hypothetical protein
MEQRRTITGGLIGWVCLVVFLTWVDWIGLLSMVSSGWSLMARIGITVLVALCGAIVVVRTLRFPALQRAILALSFVWLLMLPYIPWDETKVMVTLSGFLAPGMTKAQVQSIMSAYPGAHDTYNKGRVFCTESNWAYSKCEQISTMVFVRMNDDKVEAVEIDWD